MDINYINSESEKRGVKDFFEKSRNTLNALLKIYYIVKSIINLTSNA
ncbi:hypothetical protein [Acidianus ambivalens]|nr:hypothetical protein [Acidianus ambivalens]